jgi:uncharacterized protein
MINKKILIGILLLIILSSLCFAVDYPKLTPYVNDFAHLLTPEQITSLNTLCTNIEKNTTVEIAIVTVTKTNGEERVIYASRMGEASGVGKKATDNGVVVMWVVNEQHGAIATGRGIGDILPDIKVSHIGTASRVYFDQGDYYNGFKYIIDEIGKEVGYGNESKQPIVQDLSVDASIFIMVMVIIILLIIILGAASSSGGSGGGSFSAGNSIGGSIGSFSSGGSFGGGSFGGGGSSF